MKLSIFTPTHNPRHLSDLHRSISSQSGVADVEWIVVPNGGAEIPKEIASDPIVKVVRAPDSMPSHVGALKRFACEQATGDVFIEADHDDELMPGCLEAIAIATGGNGKKFFYSATYETCPDHSEKLYGNQFGWDHGEADGKKFNVPFPASARSLCEIFYSPNHVRAWTREAYEAAGGHNPNLSVCDDHDMMIRTYLSGAEFIMSESPLYWQKIRSDSTQIERNALIQQLQAQLRDANIEALALEWSKRHGLLALDLGGAHGCPKAYTPVDRVEIEGGIKCNLADSGLPLADRSVGVIRAMDFLEHIPIGRVVPMMNDLHRVLRHGGMLITATPSTDGRGAFCDPTHCSFWNELSFRYYSDARYSKYVPEIACRFQVVTLKTVTFSDWHRQNNLPYVVANLCANHGDRLPGMKMI